MTEFSRRTFLQSLAATAISSARPNIVLVLADDLGYGDLSSYGAQDIQTPNIDALVRSGMRFDHFYANSPVCSPTRAALLSGRYPDLVGVPGVIRTHPENSWGHLSRDAILLPVPLKAAGYQTAIIGKWHLGLEAPNTPNQRGFDFFHGFLGDMMDDYFTHRRHGNNYMRRNEEIIDPEGHATDLFTRWAIDYVNERKRDRQPFFLYLAYNAPHGPIQPPAGWLERVTSRSPGLEEKRAKIAALIEHMDDGIGRLVAALKANGQYENTLLIFVSDNGGDLHAGATCGPLRGGKQDMFEGGIRVPMCAVWPGRIAPGGKSEAVALTMDLYPTICEAAGSRTPTAVDGVSLLPLLLGAKPSLPERELIWVRREGGPRYLGQDYYAIRRGPWKLLQNTPFEPFQLFDLSQDPQEKTDLAKKERKIYAELTARLMLHVQRAGRVPWQA